MHAHHEPSESPSAQNWPCPTRSLRSSPLAAPIPRAGPEQDPTTVVLLGYTGRRTAREVLLDGLTTWARSEGGYTGLAVHTPAGLRRPDTIVAAHRGIPLVAARAGGETVIATTLTSAVQTLLSTSSRQPQLTVLGEHHKAELRAGKIHIRGTLKDPEDDQ